jgi:hypothetical protein
VELPSRTTTQCSVSGYYPVLVASTFCYLVSSESFTYVVGDNSSSPAKFRNLGPSGSTVDAAFSNLSLVLSLVAERSHTWNLPLVRCSAPVALALARLCRETSIRKSLGDPITLSSVGALRGLLPPCTTCPKTTFEFPVADDNLACKVRCSHHS